MKDFVHLRSHGDTPKILKTRWLISASTLTAKRVKLKRSEQDSGDVLG